MKQPKANLHLKALIDMLTDVLIEDDFIDFVEEVNDDPFSFIISSTDGENTEYFRISMYAFPVKPLWISESSDKES